MSLTQKRYAGPRGPARERSVRERAVRERRLRWVGVLLVSAGILLMAPAVAEALTSGVTGSGEGENLRGSGGDERVSGLGGEDALYGGGGVDHLSSGGGDDFVEASDGERDFVSCGPGADVASVDLVDLVARDCERTYPG